MIEYIYSLLILGLIYTVLVQSYNLSFGLTGLFNLGHIIFYGVGAYTAAILNTRYGFGFSLNLIFGAATAGAAAVVVGLLTLRLSSHYLAIATLGAAMIASVIASNWVSLTNGPLGIRGIEEPTLFGFPFIGDTLSFVCLYSLLTIIILWVLYRLFHSPWGRMLRAIQDDETAVQAAGKNTFNAKMWSLVLGSAFAGMAGVLYTHYRLFLDPSIFSIHEIIVLILMVIVGGRGYFWGAMFGTVLVLAIGEIPRFVGFPDMYIGALRNILFAVLLIGTMYLRPEGLWTFFSHRKS